MKNFSRWLDLSTRICAMLLPVENDTRDQTMNTGRSHEVVDPAVRGIEFLMRIGERGMKSNWQHLASPQRVPVLLRDKSAPGSDAAPVVYPAACVPVPPPAQGSVENATSA
jgi:hypothetical protein